MTATNHAVTGALVVVIVKQPVLALTLAFLAHFVMDAIPHFDIGPLTPGKYVKELTVAVDLSLAMVLTILFTIFLSGNFPAWLIFSGAFLCASPDIVWGWRYWRLKDFKKVTSEPMSLFSRWHQKIQWSETRLGLVVEFTWLAAVAITLLSKA